MPVRPNSQAVSSTRMSITIRGCLRAKPVAMFMMVSRYHRGTQECPYPGTGSSKVLERVPADREGGWALAWAAAVAPHAGAAEAVARKVVERSLGQQACCSLAKPGGTSEDVRQGMP